MSDDLQPLDTWLQHCRAVTAEVGARLVSETEIRAYLDHLLQEPSCPFDAFHALITRKPPFTEVSLGTRGADDPTETRRIDDFDAFGSICRTEIWVSATARKAGSNFNITSAVTDLLGLVKAYWKPDLRDSTSWLISRQNSERQHLIDATILYYSRDREGIALLYGDLDNFKSANDSLGESEGDRVLREFGHLIEQAAGPDSIPIHRSGDTFIVIHPTLDARIFPCPKKFTFWDTTLLPRGTFWVRVPRRPARGRPKAVFLLLACCTQEEDRPLSRHYLVQRDVHPSCFAHALGRHHCNRGMWPIHSFFLTASIL